ncbi:MAG: hypothetical protein KGL53_09195 [Elusimicrobia bacterium]|nr:hypothetical protein [Elusimicrobiota bacterium]
MSKIIVRKHSQAVKPELDFPKQGERVDWPQYTLRVSAPEGTTNVEVAIDQGDWQPCRQANGHWWFDWSGYQGGEHEAIARMETRPGRFALSDPHEFIVSL